jgi:hypothetical protein
MVMLTFNLDPIYLVIYLITYYGIVHSKKISNHILKYTYSYVGLCILGFSGTCPWAVPSNTGMHSPKSIPLYTSTSHLKELYLDGGAMQD